MAAFVPHDTFGSVMPSSCEEKTGSAGKGGPDATFRDTFLAWIDAARYEERFPTPSG